MFTLVTSRLQCCLGRIAHYHSFINSTQYIAILILGLLLIQLDNRLGHTKYIVYICFTAIQVLRENKNTGTARGKKLIMALVVGYLFSSLFLKKQLVPQEQRQMFHLPEYHLLLLYKENMEVLAEYTHLHRSRIIFVGTEH